MFFRSAGGEYRSGDALGACSRGRCLHKRCRTGREVEGDGRTNGPRSRGNIWKQETRSLRRLPMASPSFLVLPTMRDARRSKINSRLILKPRQASRLNSSAECSLCRIKAAVSTPVHLFSVTGKYATAPVLNYSGGVDTYKMDLHPVCLTLAQPRRYGLAYDIPGTGESPVSLSLKGDEIVLGIVNEAEDRRREGRVSRIFLRRKLSAMTGLSGAVDAAIVNGGPVDKAEDAYLEAPAR
jgi:hypothetical protein